MPKLKDNFIKERYLKDQKYIFVYDTYTANLNKRNVTAKFYSKYEGSTDETDQKYLEKLRWAKDYGPKEKIPWPETSNQWYGWYSLPLVELDRSDRRLYFPQVVSEMTKHGIKMLEVNTKRNKQKK